MPSSWAYLTEAAEVLAYSAAWAAFSLAASLAAAAFSVKPYSSALVLMAILALYSFEDTPDSSDFSFTLEAPQAR